MVRNAGSSTHPKLGAKTCVQTAQSDYQLDVRFVKNRAETFADEAKGNNSPHIEERGKIAWLDVAFDQFEDFF